MAENTFTYLKESYTEHSGKPVQVALGNTTQKTLDDILAAITKNNKLSEEGNNLQNQSNITASDAADKSETEYLSSERSNRARANAVYGKVDKVFSATQTLKEAMLDALKALGNIVKEGLKKSLRSYDDMTKSMRQQFLTTKQIAEAGLKADQSKQFLSDKFNIEINSGEFKKIATQLAEKGYDLNTISKEQLAAITALNKTTGIDIEQAFKHVMTSSNIGSLIRTAINASDVVGRNTTAELFNISAEPFFRDFAKKVGGTEKALEIIQNSAKALDATLGGYGLDEKSQASLLKESFTLFAGRLENSKEEELMNLLAIAPNDMDNPEKVIEGIKRTLKTETQENFDKMARLLESAHISQPLLSALKEAREAINQGNYREKNIRSFEENKLAINQAQEGGRVGGFLDSIVSGLNVMTGGLLSDLSAYTNELFGENLTMETIVSNGFKLVTKILIGILTSKIFSSGFDVIKSVVDIGGKAGVGASLKGLTGKLGVGIKSLTKSAGVLAKGVGVAGAAVAVGAGIYSVYKAATDDSKKDSVDQLVSESAKEKQRKAIEENKKTKITANAVNAGIIASAAILGGVVGGPVGLIIGGLGGIIGYFGNKLVKQAEKTADQVYSISSWKAQIEDIDSMIETLEKGREEAKTPEEKAKFDAAIEQKKAEKAALIRDNMAATIAEGIQNKVKRTEENKQSLDKVSQSLQKLKSEQDNLVETLKLLQEQQDNTPEDQRAGNYDYTQRHLKIEEIKNKIAANNQDAKKQFLAKAMLSKEGDASIDPTKSFKSEVERLYEDVTGEGWFNLQEDDIMDFFEKPIILSAGESSFSNIEEAFSNYVTSHDFKKTIEDNKPLLNAIRNGDTHVIQGFVDALSSNHNISKEKVSNILLGIIQEQIASEYDKTISRTTSTAALERLYNLKDHDLKVMEEYFTNALSQLANPIPKNANGSIVTSPMLSMVGEAGKEIILPLTRPRQMANLISKLTSAEQGLLLQSLLHSNTNPNLSRDTNSYTNSLYTDSALSNTKLDVDDVIMSIYDVRNVCTDIRAIVDGRLTAIHDIIKHTFTRLDRDTENTDDSISIISAAKEAGKKIPFIGKLFDFFADGGIVNKATASILGEDGKEAVLPLTKPYEMKNVLTRLTTNEKRQLLEALFSDKDNAMLTWELLGNVLFNELGIGKTAAKQKIKDKLYGLDDLPKEEGVAEQLNQPAEQVSKDSILEEQRRLLREATLTVLSKANGDVYNMIRAYAYDALKNIDLASSKEMSEYLGYIVNYLRDIASNNKRMNNTISPMRPAAKQFK